MSSPPLFTLPLEIHFKIFSFLEDRLGLLRCVHPFWKELIDSDEYIQRDVSTWNSISIIQESPSLFEFWFDQNCEIIDVHLVENLCKRNLIPKITSNQAQVFKTKVSKLFYFSFDFRIGFKLLKHHRLDLLEIWTANPSWHDDFKSMALNRFLFRILFLYQTPELLEWIDGFKSYFDTEEKWNYFFHSYFESFDSVALNRSRAKYPKIDESIRGHANCELPLTFDQLCNIYQTTLPLTEIDINLIIEGWSSSHDLKSAIKLCNCQELKRILDTMYSLFLVQDVDVSKIEQTRFFLDQLYTILFRITNIGWLEGFKFVFDFILSHHQLQIVHSSKQFKPQKNAFITFDFIVTVFECTPKDSNLQRFFSPTSILANFVFPGKIESRLSQERIKTLKWMLFERKLIDSSLVIVQLCNKFNLINDWHFLNHILSDPDFSFCIPKSFQNDLDFCLTSFATTTQLSLNQKNAMKSVVFFWCRNFNVEDLIVAFFEIKLHHSETNIKFLRDFFKWFVVPKIPKIEISGKNPCPKIKDIDFCPAVIPVIADYLVGVEKWRFNQLFCFFFNITPKCLKNRSLFVTFIVKLNHDFDILKHSLSIYSSLENIHKLSTHSRFSYQNFCDLFHLFPCLFGFKDWLRTFLIHFGRVDLLDSFQQKIPKNCKDCENFKNTYFI